MTYSVIVEYEGAEFTVTGDWQNGEPYTEYDPPGFAGFEHATILFGTDIKDNEYDIWEILSVKAQDEIIAIAEEEILGR